MSEIDDIRKRLESCPIPENAQADWQGSNHYEIHAVSDDGFWWLDYLEGCMDSRTDEGKRLGAVLDYACAYRRDVGALLKRIAALEAELFEERARRGRMAGYE